MKNFLHHWHITLPSTKRSGKYQCKTTQSKHEKLKSICCSNLLKQILTQLFLSSKVNIMLRNPEIDLYSFLHPHSYKQDTVAIFSPANTGFGHTKTLFTQPDLGFELPE